MTQPPPYSEPPQQPYSGQAQAPQQAQGMQPQAFQQPGQQFQPPHQQYPGQQQQYPAQQQAYAARDKVNTFGVIALAILLVNVLVSPIVSYSTLGLRLEGYQTVNTVMSWVQPILNLTAVGFAIAGVLQRNTTRLRWMAIGALTAGTLMLTSTALFWFAGWIYSLTI